MEKSDNSNSNNSKENDKKEANLTVETAEIEGEELKNEANSVEEMNFFAHLTELRKRLVISVVSITICCTVAAFFISDLMREIFLKPAFDASLSLQNLQPFGQPFLYFKVIIASGLIVGMPIVLYQFWLFIAPALYEKEKKWIAIATFFTSFCFIGGVIFSYFVLIPTMLQFAASFGSELIDNKIDVNAYFGFVSMILIACGVLFELPMISYILSKMELITPKLLAKYRRHSIIVILVLAAILTPTPDPISQLIFAAPIFILYELSILISWFVCKSSKKQAEITEDF